MPVCTLDKHSPDELEKFPPRTGSGQQCLGYPGTAYTPHETRHLSCTGMNLGPTAPAWGLTIAPISPVVHSSNSQHKQWPGGLRSSPRICPSQTITCPPTISCKYERAILEWLCSLVGLQVPPLATSSDKNTSKTQNLRRRRSQKDNETMKYWWWKICI